MPSGNPQFRNGRGRFVRTVEQAEKDREIAYFYMGRTYRQTAAHFDMAVSSIHDAVERAKLAAIVPAGDDILSMELLKLEVAERAILEVMRAHHIVVSDGRVVFDPRNDQLLTDHKPVMAAVREWLRILDQRAKYRGLYAPTKHIVEVVDEVALRAEADKLMQELADLESSQQT